MICPVTGTVFTKSGDGPGLQGLKCIHIHVLEAHVTMWTHHRLFLGPGRGVGGDPGGSSSEELFSFASW